MHSFTDSSLGSFPFIGHLLATLIIAYGSVTAAYASDTVNINTASIEVLADGLALVPSWRNELLTSESAMASSSRLRLLAMSVVLVRVYLPRTKEKS